MTDTAPSPTGTANSARALAIAALGTLLTLMAFTAPLATINSTAADLMSDAAGRTWILSSMSIGLAAALLTTGTVADDFGRRRTFALGAVVLAVGAIVCALAPNTLIFVLARILQGLGGAAVVASSLGIIAHTHPAGPVRAKASGVWGASVGAGIALGPLLAAVLDRSASWRTAYVVLAIATLALAAAAHVLVEESRSDAPAASIRSARCCWRRASPRCWRPWSRAGRAGQPWPRSSCSCWPPCYWARSWSSNCAVPLRCSISPSSDTHRFWPPPSPRWPPAAASSP